MKAGVKEDVQSLKTDMPAKAKEQIEGLKDPTKTQVYTSIFRHKHDDTPRNRALGVLSNVFLHLHPAKINRDAVRYSYTWGMGGITFYLFIVLTFTGVLLMFYYHPEQSAGLPRRPLSRTRRSLRQTAAQHAPLGRAFDGDRGLAAHVPSFSDGLVQEAARVQLEYRRAAAWCSRCCSRSPATCFLTINSDSGPSRWERTWLAPRRCWDTKAHSAKCSA